MIYTLFIWTVVGFAGAGTQVSTTFKKEMDWRPLATVEPMYLDEKNDAKLKAKCEEVARQLNIKPEQYRCVRTK